MTTFSSVNKARLGTIILIMYVVSLNSAFASQHGVEDQVVGVVKEGVDELIDKLTEDIDFSKDNFLNVTDDEAEDIKDSGQDVLGEVIDLFLAVKTFAKDGVRIISPYEISDFLLGIIAFAFAIVFILSILKAIGKHVFIMIMIGLSIVALFIFLGI